MVRLFRIWQGAAALSLDLRKGRRFDRGRHVRQEAHHDKTYFFRR